MAKLLVRVKGSFRRKGYSKKVPDKGAPGRTPPEKRWFKPKGTLQGWGKDIPLKSRRRILTHMVRTQSYATVVRKLNALRNVSTDRETDKVAKADMKWLHSKYR